MTHRERERDNVECIHFANIVPKFFIFIEKKVARYEVCHLTAKIYKHLTHAQAYNVIRLLIIFKMIFVA